MGLNGERVYRRRPVRRAEMGTAFVRDSNSYTDRDGEEAAGAGVVRSFPKVDQRPPNHAS